jgi:four helix bundle protein
MDKRELQNRTKEFALRVLNLVDALPSSAAGRAISNQLVRAATSVGANYRAACRSRSRAGFAAKLGVVAEEADETVYWLELLRDGNLLPATKLSELLKEANELTAIFTAGRRSSSRTQTSNLKTQTSNMSS